MMKAEQAFETSLIGLVICVRLMNNVQGMNNFLFFFLPRREMDVGRPTQVTE